MKIECNHKKKLFYCGLNPATGKRRIVYSNAGNNAVIFDLDKKTFTATNISSKVKSDKGKIIYRDFDLVGCGNCIACRLRQSMEYANRAVLENGYHSSAYFITLTYNDANVRTKVYVNDDGVFERKMTLCRKDLQDFIKRLRKYSDNKLMIIQAGEYGKNTFRPHYHLIVWDLDLPDLELYSTSKHSDNFKLYTSKILQDIWSHGYAVVAEVSYETIAYVCRYNLKKQKNNLDEVYEKTGIEKEFRQFPQKPGLGKRYFDENYSRIYKYDSIVHEGLKFKKCSVPKYFDFLLDKIDKELYDSIKERRKEKMSVSDYVYISSEEVLQIQNYADIYDEALENVVAHLKGDI